MMKNKLLVIIIIAIVFALGATVIFTHLLLNRTNIVNKTINTDNISLNFQTEIGNIIINAPLRASPVTVPIYKGYYQTEGRIDYTSPNWTKNKNSIPSISEAPLLIEKALVPYGGLPNDAVLDSVSQIIGYEIKTTTGEKIPVSFESTRISYRKEIDGMPITGATGQGLAIELGENGELLHLFKKWRTLEKIGDTPIINASEAIEKLQRGDVLEIFQNPVDVTINQIKLGYYEGYPDRQEEILEPVWIFYGTTTNGDNIQFFVDARESGSVLEFANFTATPIYGTAPLTVAFTDTSTSNVWDWYWDFGDGSSSTQQNPVHLYQANGKYTVTIRVADENRLDTHTKYNYITVLADPVTLIDQLIQYINSQNINKVAKKIYIDQLNGVKKSLTTNKLGDAIIQLKAFKLTAQFVRGGLLTTEQASIMQTSATAIISAINVPVNQQAIDMTKTLNSYVKNLGLPRLTQGILTLELDGAQLNLEAGKDKEALDHFTIFIKTVKTQDGKAIPHDKAMQLIAKAQDIVNVINK